MNRYYIAQAVKITSPVFFGYIAIGIPFGLMVTTAGYPWWLAPLMSLLMYAGAGQYVAIGLFASGVPLTAIAVTELLLNIRHIVYGLSLISGFKNTGKWKPFLIFALTDETYALLTGVKLPKHTDPGAFYGTIALLNYSYWVSGSTIGAAAGAVLPFSFEGVDFALTALFAVMLVNRIKSDRDFLPVIIGASVTVFAVILSKAGILDGKHILICALSAGIASLIIFRGNKSTKEISNRTEP